MAIACGQNLKVQVTSPEGHVIEMSGLVSRLDINSSFNEVVVAEFTVMCEPERLFEWFGNNGSDYREHVIEARKSTEWQCDFCGRPNKRERETCKSCNAVRPFIYE